VAPAAVDRLSGGRGTVYSMLRMPAADRTRASTAIGAGPTGFREQPTVDVSAEYMLLAWIRTSLMMIIAGFVVARFPMFLRQHAADQRGGSWFPGASLWMGTGLVVVGVLVVVLAAAQHVRFVRGLASVDVLARERSWFAVGVALALAQSATSRSKISHG
jgi:uncharacterized membrane protein YidH (DUF202 family)